MQDLSVSLVVTVLNEESTIEVFVDSIMRQTKKPDEVIIVDGGSTDKTITILKTYKKKIKIIKLKGNRSVGRNIGITKAKGKIILVSDSGCLLDKDWVKNITVPFRDKNVDVVSGFYKPITKTVFQKCLACYTCVMKDKVDKRNFLPSSRSIAFKKSAWQKVGGYPEHLDTCEDLVFAKKLKKRKFTFCFTDNALVYWNQRKNILEAFKQFFSYAQGDGKAFYMRFSTPFLFLRVVVFSFFIYSLFKNYSAKVLLWVVLLTLLYLFWAVIKNYKYVKRIEAFIYLPLLQITSDVAVFSGTLLGLFLRLKI